MRGISGGFGFLRSTVVGSRFPGFVKEDKAWWALVKGVGQKGLGITPRLIECDRRAYLGGIPCSVLRTIVDKDD